MNSWTVIASVASIIAVVFHLSGKASSLRQFTFPITTSIIGLTIGRHYADVSQLTNLLSQDPYLILILAVTILLFGFAMYLVEATKPEAKVSFIILVFLSTVAIPQLIRSYNDISPQIATQDYLTLARLKETSGNTEDAIKYLGIYSKRVGKADLQKQIVGKIDTLRKQQLKQAPFTVDKTKIEE